LTGIIPENVTSFGNVGVIEIKRKKIAFCHYDWLAGKLFETKSYDFVFYGHTHTPWEERRAKGLLLNPGEVAGQFGHASFAIIDLENGKSFLKLLK
jgi:predicted phosphodiesterase